MTGVADVGYKQGIYSKRYRSGSSILLVDQESYTIGDLIKIKAKKKVQRQEGLFPIGVSSKLVGLSIPTLRLYEKEGLVIPLKTESRRRFYSDLDLRIIRSIHHLIQAGGLNFAGVRRLLALLPCWDMKPCCEGAHRTCSVPSISDRPCWTVEGTICRQMEMDCRSCHVYGKAAEVSTIKGVIYGSLGEVSRD